MRPDNVVGFFVGVFSLACGPGQAQISETASGNAERVEVTEMNDSNSIGTATMLNDRTIVLNLRATGPRMIGDARITYAPDHPNYAEVLKHLEGLRPGQAMQVKPWPTKGRN